MSQHSTRCPSSAKATARLSVVVVLATPPFWLANAITLQVAITKGSDASGYSSRLYSHARGEILSTCPAPAVAFATARRSRMARRQLFSTPVPGLLRRRLIFVTGKGGVGKSTVATALGVLAARRGLRTIVAELASQDRVRQSFGQEGDVFHELKLAENLFTISVDPQNAMDEYL